MIRCVVSLLLVAVVSGQACFAEDGYDLWLRYVKSEDVNQRDEYRRAIPRILVAGESETARAIRAEVERAIPAILGSQPKFVSSAQLPAGNGLIIGTTGALRQLGVELPSDDERRLGEEGFAIETVANGAGEQIVVYGNTEVATLYGVFHFIRLLQTNQAIEGLDVSSLPRIKRRLLNHWDNLDGSIERGYAGSSLWKWGSLPDKLDPRYTDYARACASVGVNGMVLNNVNAAAEILSAEYIAKWAALANVFRPYGVRVYVTARWDSPMKLDGLTTADPNDPRVQQWWADKANEIYAAVPDFGGFLVKANSEGQPGPLTYGASHSEGANMLARAVAPHGGIVMWRAFVYDFDIGEDRANCAFNEFTPIDGEFLPNVSLQVKNGPIDFQPREPFSPLFGAAPKTSLTLELQITQEYLGHAKHWVYLAPMWTETLQADTYAQGEGSTIGKRIAGKVFPNELSIIAGVANVGDSQNWCGHHGAQANWYAFGRLAWDHTLSPEAIADEWARATWSNDAATVAAIKQIMLPSWETCVNYMTPLGLHHIMKSGDHYGPDPGQAGASQAYWNNTYYHRADDRGLGANRSSAGSNAAGQYNEPLRSTYDSLDTCPDKYLLWFHHVPWDYPMRSGRTMWQELQHRYETGVSDCREMSVRWDALRGRIDEQRHREVAALFEEQVRNAEEWRDVCLDYFSSFAEPQADETSVERN